MKIQHALLYLIILSSCSQKKIDADDINKLVQKKSAFNLELLESAKKDILRFDVFEDTAIQTLTRLHERVTSFLDVLNSLNDDELHAEYNSFVAREFPKFHYTMHEPVPPVLIEPGTPVEIAKLHLVEFETIYLRHWEDWAVKPASQFIDVHPIVIPDKAAFSRNEPITGKITLAAFPKHFREKMYINDEEVSVNDGTGYFTIQPMGNSSKTKILHIEGRISIKGDSVDYKTKTSVLIY